jgi:hypothetical protein
MYRARLEEQRVALVPWKVAAPYAEMYEDIFETQKADAVKRGMTKTAAAALAVSIAKEEVRSAFEKQERFSYLPLVGKPGSSAKSLTSELGEVVMVPAQPRGNLARRFAKFKELLPVGHTPQLKHLTDVNAPRLCFTNKKGEPCVLVGATTGAGMIWGPFLKSIAVLTETSKMSAPSFSLPAGATIYGGTCVSAAIGSRDPCQKNICARWYAGGGNYAFLQNAASGTVRLEWVRRLVQQDRTGKKFARAMTEAISSYAAFGRQNKRSDQEIGIWTGKALQKYGLQARGRNLPSFPTELGTKRLMKPEPGTLSVMDVEVKAEDFGTNKVPGGKIQLDKVTLASGKKAEPYLRSTTGLRTFLRDVRNKKIRSASCQVGVMAGVPDAGQKVPLPVTSTAQLYRKVPAGKVAGFFRIHDAGDATIGTNTKDNTAYQLGWYHVAKMLPHVWFWQPTRAWKAAPRDLQEAFGKCNTLANFTLRPSAIEVDVSAPTIVYTKDYKILGGPMRWLKAVDLVLDGKMPGVGGALKKTKDITEQVASVVYKKTAAKYKMAAGTTVNTKVPGAGAKSKVYVFVDDERGVACWSCPVYSKVIESSKGYIEAKSCHDAECRFCWLAKDYPVTYGAH